MGGESNGNIVTVTVNTEGVRCYKVHLLYKYNKCPLGRGGHSPISVTDTMLLFMQQDRRCIRTAGRPRAW